MSWMRLRVNVFPLHGPCAICQPAWLSSFSSLSPSEMDVWIPSDTKSSAACQAELYALTPSFRWTFSFAGVWNLTFFVFWSQHIRVFSSVQLVSNHCPCRSFFRYTADLLCSMPWLVPVACVGWLKNLTISDHGGVSWRAKSEGRSSSSLKKDLVRLAISPISESSKTP